MATYTQYVLGTGGHARALKALYPEARLIAEGDEASVPKGAQVIVGWLGQTPEALRARIEKVAKLMADGLSVSVTPIIMPGASVCPTSLLWDLCVVNQGAVVCHDCTIGNGVHVGPGAVVCGGVIVGPFSMVGAGAVVLPNAIIPPETLVKANTRFPK